MGTEVWNKVSNKSDRASDGWVDGKRQGRHSNAYHEWVLSEMDVIDKIAQGNKDIFLDLFEQNIKSKVINNPGVSYFDYWKNLK